MKTARKWVDRISLTIFAVSMGYIYLTADQFPEAQAVSSSSEAIIKLAIRVFL